MISDACAGRCAREEIRNYLDMLYLFNESTDDFLYVWDFATDLVYFARDISEHGAYPKRPDFCYTREELERGVYGKDSAVAILDKYSYLRNGDKKVKLEYRIINGTGDVVWVSNTATTLYKDGEPIAAMGCVSTHTMGKKVDQLSGLLNHVKFEEDINAYLELHQCGYLVVFGIDGLKEINSKYGRAFGDYLIKMTGKTIEEFLPPSIHVYKMLGDEFAVNLHCSDRKQVEKLFAKVRQKLKNYCTVSAGAVHYSEKYSNTSAVLYQYAETAMGNNEGTDSLNFFSIKQYEEYVNRLGLLEEIRQSVHDGCRNFFLVYQPIIDAVTHRPTGAEALLRYKSPVQGVVYPDSFIPVLEETGLIEQVGHWVAESALAQCVEWRRLQPDFCISINISYVQLKKGNVEEDILGLLQASGLPGGALTVEVTENIRIQEYKQFNEIFKRWKDAGIRIAIDDFGSGYANFSYLKNIAADKIKVDRELISGIDSNEYNRQLLSNVFRLAHNAMLSVCCEGVEEKAELDVLADLEPDEYQGYIFSHPLDRDAFESIYVDGASAAYKERQQRDSMLKKERDVLMDDALHYNKAALKNMLEETIKESDVHRYFPEEASVYMLQISGIGLWFMRLEDGGVQEMFVNKTCAEILGIDRELSPDEVYRHWYSRIGSGYYHYVESCVAKILNRNTPVQLEYTWVHPSKGEVTVRCVGCKVLDSDGKVYIVGYHRIISELSRPSFMEEKAVDEIFEYNEDKKSIYFHTKRTLLYGDTIHEKAFPQCWVDEGIVHPDFAEQLLELFSDVRRIKEDVSSNLLLKEKGGDYGWFRLTLRHLEVEQESTGVILVIADRRNPERACE